MSGTLLWILAFSVSNCPFSRLDAERAFTRYAEQLAPKERIDVKIEVQNCVYFGLISFLPYTPDMNAKVKMDADGTVWVLTPRSWKKVSGS